MRAEISPVDLHRGVGLFLAEKEEQQRRLQEKIHQMESDLEGYYHRLKWNDDDIERGYAFLGILGEAIRPAGPKPEALPKSSDIPEQGDGPGFKRGELRQAAHAALATGNGAVTLSDIANAISNKYGMPPADLRKRTRGALHQLKGQGIAEAVRVDGTTYWSLKA